MQKKTGRGAHYFLKNEPISPLFACVIAQLVVLKRFAKGWSATPHAGACTYLELRPRPIP
jgi:hypothetical protein